MNNRAPRVFRPDPLTREAFSAFGEIVSHTGTAQRHYLTQPFERAAEARRTMLWVSRVEQPRSLPLCIERFERHPHSAQTFIPLEVNRYLVVVAPQGNDGQPDAARIRAFIAGREQGVCYGRGVWHHGLTVLDAPAEFAVLMSMRGESDDEFVDLAEPVQIEAVADWHGDIST